MYCTRCGTKLRHQASFCHKCGQRVRTLQSTTNIITVNSELGRLKRKIVNDERVVALRSAIIKRLNHIANQLSSATSNSSLARLSPERKQKILEVIKSLQTRLDDKENIEDVNEWTKSLEIRVEGTRCLVCLQDLSNGKEKILACPHCLYPSHESHITSWLRMKNVCPLCRTKVSLSELIPVNHHRL